MRKAHPCGSDLWQVTRTGMDFGMKPRVKFERMVKSVVAPAGE